MMHIRDFTLSCKFGGCYNDWDYLEKIMNTYWIDISEVDLRRMDHFHDILSFCFDYIQCGWEKYISEQEGKQIILDLERHYNYMCSDIDVHGNYHWADKNDEAYEIWKK